MGSGAAPRPPPSSGTSAAAPQAAPAAPPPSLPLTTCGWGAYMRFHGSRGSYLGSYGPAELGRWAARAGALARAGREVPWEAL